MSLRSRSFPAFLSAALVLIAVVATNAANQVAVTESKPVEKVLVTPVLGYMTDEQAADLKPMFREIHEVIVAERQQIGALEARLESVRDPIAALDIQREISNIKERAEIEVFQVQATYARREGRIDQALEIDAVVETMQARLREPGQER
jgi:hypothetical protein